MESFLLQALKLSKFRTSPDLRILQKKEKKWVLLWVFYEYKNGFSYGFLISNYKGMVINSKCIFNRLNIRDAIRTVFRTVPRTSKLK